MFFRDRLLRACYSKKSAHLACYCSNNVFHFLDKSGYVSMDFHWSYHAALLEFPLIILHMLYWSFHWSYHTSLIGVSTEHIAQALLEFPLVISHKLYWSFKWSYHASVIGVSTVHITQALLEFPLVISHKHYWNFHWLYHTTFISLACGVNF